MQEALRFRSLDAEPVKRADYTEQVRQLRPVTDAPRRGLSLTIRGLRKSFGDNEVLRGIDLHIPAGQSVAIVGRSGCGKSTLLRLIAGLETATAGTISLGEDARPEDVRVMFQEPRLLPWARVLSNVEVGLGRERHSPDAQARAERALGEVGLADKRTQWPAVLSGGQKQRVALARALVIEPPLLMFDEPLSNLDAKLRIDMRVEIRQLQRANRTTAVYVTHDQEEAFSISDRVAIMNAGRIMQFDTPETLYQRPANAFVARFVGFENLIPMKVVARDGESVRAEAAGGAKLTLSRERFGEIPDSFLFAARADGLNVTPGGGEGVPATTGLRTYLGRAYQSQCDTAAGPIVANGALSQPLEPGSAATLVPVPDQCCVLKAE